MTDFKKIVEKGAIELRVAHGETQVKTKSYSLTKEPSITDELKTLFLEQLKRIPNDGDENLKQYDLGNIPDTRVIYEYKSSEPGMEHLMEIYNLDKVDPGMHLFEDLSDVKFYYVSASHHETDEKIIGFKSTMRLKVLLKEKGKIKLMLSAGKDGVVKVKNNILQISNDFDFILTKDKAYIFNPFYFDNIADIKEQVKQIAPKKLDEIQEKVDFLDLEPIKAKMNYQNAKQICAIVSLEHHDGLSRENFIETSKKENVQLSIDPNTKKIAPAEGYEKDFLDVISRRLYSVVIKETGEVEHYRADARHPRKPKRKVG